MKMKIQSVVLSLILVLTAGSFLFADGKAKPININTADVAELTTLPRIGTSVAKRITAYRQENGAFERIEEIMNVRGIGQRTFDRIKELITVGEKDPDSQRPRAEKNRS